MVAGSFYIPKKNPAKPDGEDAHFFCKTAQVIGVADGVGGWARQGIDAGKYARQLMRHAADFVKYSTSAAVDPKSVIAAAHAKTARRGSSTACIISLAGSRLRAAYVGDSGFAVIRARRTAFRSPAQLYKFNAPYQLRARSGGAEKAVEIEMEMEIGDVVVVGTDGLFDNMFPEEVEAMVERCLKAEELPETVARKLAKAAVKKSRQRTAATPYEVAAREAGISHSGGKKDDITVVVAYVQGRS